MSVSHRTLGLVGCAVNAATLVIAVGNVAMNALVAKGNPGVPGPSLMAFAYIALTVVGIVASLQLVTAERLCGRQLLAAVVPVVIAAVGMFTTVKPLALLAVTGGVLACVGAAWLLMAPARATWAYQREAVVVTAVLVSVLAGWLTYAFRDGDVAAGLMAAVVIGGGLWFVAERESVVAEPIDTPVVP